MAEPCSCSVGSAPKYNHGGSSDIKAGSRSHVTGTPVGNDCLGYTIRRWKKKKGGIFMWTHLSVIHSQKFQYEYKVIAIINLKVHVLLLLLQVL